MNTVFVVCVALYGALILIEAVKLGLALLDLFEDDPKAESALKMTLSVTVLGSVLFFFGGALWDRAIDVMAQDTLALKYWGLLACFGVVFGAYWYQEYKKYSLNDGERHASALRPR